MTDRDSFQEDPVFGFDAGQTPMPLGFEAVSPDEMVSPSGGEASTSGGLGIQILRVFVENKLAVAGLIVVVGMVIFCFIGPFFYHTDQTNQQAVLNSSAVANTGPGKG